MAKQINQLTPVAVNSKKGKGLYPDGNNLYLQVTANGVKSWVLRYMMRGKAKTMGLGPVHAVSLAEAREKAADCRKLTASGIDPLFARKDGQKKARLMAAHKITFKECATAYMEAHIWKRIYGSAHIRLEE